MIVLAIILWSILAAVVIGLAIYRRTVSSQEDDNLHFTEAEAGIVARQMALASRIETIDRWGKLLTAILAVATVLLGGWYLYYVFETGSRVTY